MSRHIDLPPCQRCEHHLSVHGDYTSSPHCSAADCGCEFYVRPRWWHEVLDIALGRRHE